MRDVIQIKELNRYVKTLLDRDEVLSGIALRGEIANFVHHYKSGHLYFTLRDDAASVKAVMFARDAQRLSFRPEEGMRVVVRCRVSLYEATGAFQVYVSDLFPDGIGAAQLAFEQLKAKLQSEGLFQQELKKRIPLRPTAIGVVTSATGAALQDIRNILSRRWPFVKLVLAPVNVQGLQAATGIAKAIATLDQSNRVDVIIVTRGGGSREDLWVFNDEGIARAAYACRTPIISAVGHEIDFTILDFVADLRAPTPSAAAELATPDVVEEMQKIYMTFMNIQENIQLKLKMCYTNFNMLAQKRSELSAGQVCAQQTLHLADMQQNLQQASRALIERKTSQLSAAGALAHSLSPYQILGRGYAMVQNEEGGCLLVNDLKSGQTVQIKGQQASALCKVLQVRTLQETTNEKT